VEESEMAGVYFYVPQKELKDVTDCGLKLSEWFDREIFLPCLHSSKKVIKTFLNPRDDRKNMSDPAYQCLRLDIDLQYCIVGDSDLYKMGLREPLAMEYYTAQLIPLSNYRFGTFRCPEALVTTSVLPERIEAIGKLLDTPVLYESSEKLYLDNILDKHEENWKDSGNHLLYAYYAQMEAQGKAKSFEDRENGKSIFLYNGNKDYIVLQNPKEGYNN
jgi:hypothetical protein